jgi:hypothetical protein
MEEMVQSLVRGAANSNLGSPVLMLANIQACRTRPPGSIFNKKILPADDRDQRNP